MRRNRLLWGAGLLVAPLLAGGGAQARLTRIHVESRQNVPPAHPGDLPYEIITGTFEGEVDPADRRNALITDIAAAPRSAHGGVAYAATFAMARPLARGSGVLFYDVPNRGNGKVAPDEDGHTRLISGWQGDIAPSPG
ncbi:MAG TPA: hypothetical protein VN222_15875, partial [Novosphingobium sp.]|nr:hypothetical protein [Novosphingobium sp.]